MCSYSTTESLSCLLFQSSNPAADHQGNTLFRGGKKDFFHCLNENKENVIKFTTRLIRISSCCIWTPPADHVTEHLTSPKRSPIGWFDALSLPKFRFFNSNAQIVLRLTMPGAEIALQDLWLHQYIDLTLKFDASDLQIPFAVNAALVTCTLTVVDGCCGFLGRLAERLHLKGRAAVSGSSLEDL